MSTLPEESGGSVERRPSLRLVEPTPNGIENSDEILPKGTSVLYLVTGETDPNADPGKWEDFKSHLTADQLKTYYGIVSSVIEEHSDYIKSLAVKFAGHKNQEEVHSATLERVLKGLRKFKGQAEITSWLYRVTYSAAASVAKKSNRLPELIDDERLSEIPDPYGSASMDGIIESEAVVEIVSQLTDSQKQVFARRHYLGMSHAEIAEELGFSETVSKVTYHRSIKKLQKYLENRENTDID